MASNLSPPFLLLFLFSLLLTTTNSASLSEQDHLLSLKSSIVDPSSTLSSWTSHDSDYCNWTHITCTTSSSVSSIDLQALGLSGEVSPSICKLKDLSSLNLARNSFNQSLPLYLSECTNLLSLNLSNNLFWGTIPDQFFLLSSLTSLDLSGNKIEGQIPKSFGSLSNLQFLNLGRNLFSGVVHPSTFSNLTQLELLDLSNNPSMESELPQEIGKLQNLKRVYLQNSGFYGEVPQTFLGLSQIEVLDLSQNNLAGEIPLSFGTGFKNLQFLDLSQNKFFGPFPTEICHEKSLLELNLHSNFLNGSIPKIIETCLALQRIQLQDNLFTGEIPNGFWSLPNLQVVRMENNGLTGQLPELDSDPFRFEQIQLDNNRFYGSIPQFIGRIQTMYHFSASLNAFNGTIPTNFCDSPIISIINLSHNSLLGSVPAVRNCKKLVSLFLSDNNLTGEIPVSLGNLPVLTYIDLSSNNLTGEIPKEIGNLKLALFNISYNNLYGSVPSSFMSLPALFLEGNPGLCGPGLPNKCGNISVNRRNSKVNGLVISLTVVSFIIGSILLVLGIFVAYKLVSHGKSKSKNTIWKSVLYNPVNISEEELMEGLNDKNLIGRGAFGKTYKVQIKANGEFVSIKRLFNSKNLSLRSLKKEIKFLARARHKNLNNILGFFHSDTETVIIYEFVQNGSLGDLICGPRFELQWRERVKIALGIARGLCYLHRDYVPVMLHRDIKSNNVLLGVDFEPRLTGFGFNRVLGEKFYKECMSSNLSYHCYVAPEEVYHKNLTEKMDVYSFGVILLELITGRPAEQPASSESLDIVRWVRRKVNIEDGPHQILDPNISNNNNNNNNSRGEMLVALELALRCTAVVPDQRPKMDEVVRVLQSLECNYRGV
ncbi:hypothetical protein LUZ60_011519 [Juncus effusus]|nr:hypothetical protein LUZ60_011519 [Juncus effusus]